MRSVWILSAIALFVPQEAFVSSYAGPKDAEILMQVTGRVSAPPRKPAAIEWRPEATSGRILVQGAHVRTLSVDPAHYGPRLAMFLNHGIYVAVPSSLLGSKRLVRVRLRIGPRHAGKLAIDGVVVRSSFLGEDASPDPWLHLKVDGRTVGVSLHNPPAGKSIAFFHDSTLRPIELVIRKIHGPPIEAQDRRSRTKYDRSELQTTVQRLAPGAELKLQEASLQLETDGTFSLLWGPFFYAGIQDGEFYRVRAVYSNSSPDGWQGSLPSEELEWRFWR